MSSHSGKQGGGAAINCSNVRFELTPTFSASFCKPLDRDIPIVSPQQPRVRYSNGIRSYQRSVMKRTDDSGCLFKTVAYSLRA
jgi:hypothetical protein